MRNNFALPFLICKLAKIMIITFIILFFCSTQNPIWAVTVANWTQLGAAVTAGDPAIVVGANISSSGTSITNNSNGTAITNAASFFISGANVSQIFNNTGTLTITGVSLNLGSSTTDGGAIYNVGTVNLTGGTFAGNKALSGSNGGAIYNLGNLNITNTNFTNSTAAGRGGAIYNNGTTTITADGANVQFDGNSDSTGSNDIYIAGGTLNLDAKGSNQITFFSGISGSLGSGNIYKTETGTLNLYGDCSRFSGNFYQANGITNVSNKFFAALNAIQGGTLNFESGSSILAGSNIQLTNSSTEMNIEEGTTIVNGLPVARIGVGAGTTLNIKNTSSLGFNATLEGAGTINKTAGGTTNFTKDNHSFTGLYNQADGVSNVSNNFFGIGSTSTINAGTLNFQSGGTILVGSNIILNGSATSNMLTGSTTNFSTPESYANITVNDSAIFDIQKNDGGLQGLLYLKFSGDGNVEQTGSGQLHYYGDNHNFIGSFTQTAGTAEIGSTVSTTIFGFFGGASTITGASTILNFNGGTEYYNRSSISLLSGATMNINSSKGSFTTKMDAKSSIDLASGTTLNIYYSKDLDLNTSLSGTGTINKLSTGTTDFKGDNTVFTGTYQQSDGTSNFNTASSFFGSGVTNLSGGTLNLGSDLTYQGAGSFFTFNLTNSNPMIPTVMNINDGASIPTDDGGSIFTSFSVGSNTELDINTTSGTLAFNANITGASGTVNKNNSGTVNFNGTIDTVTLNQNAGTSNLKNTLSSSTLNLNGGIFAVNNESYINSTNLNNLGINGGTLNTQNGLIGTLAFNNVTAGGTTNWLIDVDLANVIGDKITAANPATGGGSLNISNINLWSDASAPSTAVVVANGNAKNNVGTSVTSINSALFSYAVSYNNSGANGVLNFVKTGVSPNAITADVSQTSTFLLQTAIDRQFFGNVDAFMSFPLATRESTICCALAHDPTSGYTGGACPLSGNGTFSPIYSCDLNKGLWVKDFVSFENIPLNNGPNVSTIEYGTLIGADAPLRHLGRGVVGNTSAYVGYLGSNQNYDSVGVSQNGVLVGLAENMIYKNTFLTLMASVGSSLGTSVTKWGNDYFSSLFAGVAAKGGYNFEIKEGEYIIQPNLMLAYTYTNTPEYTTASGLEMSSKPLNAMQIAPGVRLIKNMLHKKGQVYLLANWVYNVMDKTNFTANDIQLPQLSIAPYIEYGIGYQRVWKERFTGFAQTLLRGGGRNGVAFQFGLRLAI